MPISDELQRLQTRMLEAGNLRAGAALQSRLTAEVRKIVDSIPGASLMAGSPKGLASARKKVATDYGGDWLRIKDMARCTIVLPNERSCEIAFDMVKAYFVPKNGWTTFDETVKDPRTDEGGYSGRTVFVMQGGLKGEIQINNPALMYAKDLGAYVDTFGDVGPMRAKYHLVSGGLGHWFYERFRNGQILTPIGRQHAEASKVYYAYFRSDPPNIDLGKAAAAAAAALGAH